MDIDFNYIVSQALNILLQFSVAFVPILMGTYAKESYDVMQRKRKKIRISNIVTTTLTLSCVLVGLMSYFNIINKFGLPLSFTLLFLIGAYSTKAMEMIFNGKILKILGKFLSKSKGTLQGSMDEILKEDTNDKNVK